MIELPACNVCPWPKNLKSCLTPKHKSVLFELRFSLLFENTFKLHPNPSQAILTTQCKSLGEDSYQKTWKKTIANLPRPDPSASREPICHTSHTSNNVPQSFIFRATPAILAYYDGELASVVPRSSRQLRALKRRMCISYGETVFQKQGSMLRRLVAKFANFELRALPSYSPMRSGSQHVFRVMVHSDTLKDEHVLRHQWTQQHIFTVMFAIRHY